LPLRLFGRFLALLGAAPASISTFSHVPKVVAAVRTLLADFGARPANMTMKGRAEQDDIGTGPTYFRASDQKSKMLWFNMLSTPLKAMAHGGTETNL
jgi:hypothetical protein